MISHSSIDKHSLLMSFATRYLIMGSNAVVWNFKCMHRHSRLKNALQEHFFKKNIEIKFDYKYKFIFIFIY
jgi:hypothetical protein